MADRAAIKVDGIAFHRNGVSGVGFHVVRFHFREEGKRHDLHGIVFQHSDDPDNPQATDGYVAVIDPKDPEAKFRGDNFERELREACHAHTLWQMASLMKPQPIPAEWEGRAGRVSIKIPGCSPVLGWLLMDGESFDQPGLGRVWFDGSVSANRIAHSWDIRPYEAA